MAVGRVSTIRLSCSLGLLVALVAVGGCDDDPPDCASRRSRDACEAADSDDDLGCAWAEVTRVRAASTCEAPETEGRCLPTRYQGAGCAEFGECGSRTLPNSYVRTLADGSAEIIVGSFCEYQPEGDWSPCWADEVSGSLRGDAPTACGCICGD